MSQDKTRAIIDAIITKTNSGELVWEATFDDNMFETTLKSSTVRIAQKVISVSITILNVDGAILERLNSDDFDYSYGEKLKGLYTLVRRKALKIDETLDALLNELKN